MVAFGHIEGCVGCNELAALGIGEQLGIVEAVLIYLLHFLLVQPFQSLSLLPEAKFDFALLWILESAEAVLLTLVPPALVLTAICPVVVAIACLLVVQELSLVAYTIGIDIHSVARHIVALPLAVVFAAILPHVLADAVDFVVVPIA